MPDLEKVIKGLEEISDYFFDVYHRSKDREEINKAKDRCDAIEDALTLLKGQEAVSVDNGKCPSCNWDFENGELDFSNINESRFYCPRCGQAVKFDD